nr:uncharacterized protein LOC109166807 [Ipomoea batatas]
MLLQVGVVCVHGWESKSINHLFSSSNLSPVEVWSPPPRGMLKCNVDASLFEENVGFGVVVRDHVGNFVAAYGGRL